MKQINTPEEASKALNIPLTPEIKQLKSPLKTKKKYNYTKKTGRPEKTLKDLPPDWKDRTILMALDGYSDQEIRRELCLSGGLNVRTIEHLWYRLKEKEAEFQGTLNICRHFQEAWWIGVSRKSMNKQFFQHAAWFANMKNRFGWRDKTEIDHGITDETFDKYKSMSVEDLNKKLIELMPNRVAGLLT